MWYKPVVGNAVDMYLAEYINTKHKFDPTFVIERIEDGVYLFGTRRMPLVLLHDELMGMFCLCVVVCANQYSSWWRRCAEIFG